MPTPAEFKALSDFISTVGFPIAAYVGMFVVLILGGRWAMRTGDRLADRAIEHADVMDKRQGAIAAALPTVCKSLPCAALDRPQAKPA